MPIGFDLVRPLVATSAVVATLLLAACSSGSDGSAASTTSTSRPVTTTQDPTRIDPALLAACRLRTADLIDETNGSGTHRVPMMSVALRGSQLAALRALADELTGASAAQVHVPVNQLTRLCVEAGYKFPNGYADP